METAVEIKETRKNQIIEKLSTYYSLNYMSLEEYERLIAYSNNIETDKELDILENIIEGTRSQSGMKNDDSEPSYQSLENQREYYTILSSRKTSGSILKKENVKLINILGEHQIILGDDDLVRRETELKEVRNLMDKI